LAIVNTELKNAPLPSIKRLPIYLNMLRLMQVKGRPVVSCTHIADDLHLDPTQVRKDLAITGIIGRPKVGYQVPELIQSIEAFLGWKKANEAFLVGVGNLGSALLGYEGFAHLGLKIIAAFDSHPEKAGKTIHGREVFPLEQLPSLASRMHVHIGVLTVPASAAQSAADVLIGSGIRAIWNFTATRLDAPPDTIVENVELASSLAVLSSKLEATMKNKKKS
jgi:redox-sensing transcriptional repressor